LTCRKISTECGGGVFFLSLMAKWYPR
jgi:hypothetical protein